MGKHLPTVVWGLRPLVEDEKPNGYVQTVDKKRLRIVYRQGRGHGWQTLEMDRRTARMLARRINACLDETRG